MFYGLASALEYAESVVCKRESGYAVVKNVIVEELEKEIHAIGWMYARE